MNTQQVNSKLKSCAIFRGTFSRNNVPKTKERPVAYIINTDSEKEPGEHWVAVYLRLDGVCIYFDPFGFPPLHEDFVNFIKSSSPNGLVYSSLSLQNVFSTLCGWYCIDFVQAMETKSSLKSFLKQFRKCTLCNDELLMSKYNIQE